MRAAVRVAQDKFGRRERPRRAPRNSDPVEAEMVEQLHEHILLVDR